MRSSTSTLTSHDGAPLAVRSWLPEGEPRAVIQLAHGMAEHSGRYEPLAVDLTDAGFAVWIHDHRGHGDTAAEPSDEGYFADDQGWDTAVRDMHAVTDQIQATHPGLPIVFVGHSMGSLLGRDFVSRYGHQFAGAVFSGTGGDQGLLGKVGQALATAQARVRGRRHTSGLMNTLTFGAFNKGFAPARTDFDWLSRDESVVDAYIADPRCGQVFTAGFFADLLGGVNRLPGVVERIPTGLPIYLFSGDRDPVGGNGVGVQGVADSLTAAGLTDVTLRLYEDGRHEMLNEINRDEVVADLIAWIDARVDSPA